MTSRFQRYTPDFLLACAVAVLALLYSVSLATRPVSEGWVGLGASVLSGAILLAHALAYAAGPRLRMLIGTAVYLFMQAVILLAVGFLYPPLLLILVLYAAITAQTVVLLGRQIGVMPVFLGAVLVVAVSTGVTGGVYRGATIAAIIAALGLVMYAISGALRSRTRSTPTRGTESRSVLPVDSVLTARELEVLRYAAAGARSKEIGARLSITERTVKAHLARAYQKLGAETRAEAIAIAARRGLLS